MKQNKDNYAVTLLAQAQAQVKVVHDACWRAYKEAGAPYGPAHADMMRWHQEQNILAVLRERVLAERDRAD